jgi:acyl carrier protein
VPDSQVDLPELVSLMIRLADGERFDADTPLLSTGILDSFAVQELLVMVEEHYGASIPVEELGVDNADTPAQLADLIQAYR